MTTVARTASSVHSLTSRARLRPALASIVLRAIAGITGSGSVLLSDIVRGQVDEGDDKALRSAEQQLSFRLGHDEDLDQLPQAYLQEMAPFVGQMPFFTLDGGDLSKPSSRKLQYLDVVRDGSAKPRDKVAVGSAGVVSLFARKSEPSCAPTETTSRKAGRRTSKTAPRQSSRSSPQPKRQPAPRRSRRQARKDSRGEAKAERVKYPSAPALKKLGYWLVTIEAGDGKGNHVPLSIDVFSTQDPDYQALGEDAWAQTFQSAVLRVLEHAGKEAIWLMDRGFDDVAWMNWMHGRVGQYGTRLKKDRKVRPGTREANEVKVGVLVESLDYRHTVLLRRVNKSTHKETWKSVPLAWVPVWIDGVDHAQYVVVAQTGKRTRLMVVTDVRPETAEQAGQLISAYLERWGNEEATRALKQLTGLENIRVRSLVAIRRLVWLALIAVGIQSAMTLGAGRLARAVLDRCKEFIAEVRYKIYRIWRVVRQDMIKAIERRSAVLQR